MGDDRWRLANMESPDDVFYFSVGDGYALVLHRDTPKDVMESQSPMGRPSTVNDITDAVMYLTDAATVTGDILYVDGGAHFGRW